MNFIPSVQPFLAKKIKVKFLLNSGWKPHHLNTRSVNIYFVPGIKSEKKIVGWHVSINLSISSRHVKNVPQSHTFYIYFFQPVFLLLRPSLSLILIAVDFSTDANSASQPIFASVLQLLYRTDKKLTFANQFT